MAFLRAFVRPYSRYVPDTPSAALGEGLSSVFELSDTDQTQRRSAFVRPHSIALVRVGGRTGLIWFTSLLVLAAGARQVGGAAALALLASAVWSVSITGALRSARIKRIAVGPGAAIVAGVFAGTVVLSALPLWLPIGFTPLRLAVAGVLAALAVTAWERFVAHVLPHSQRVLIVGAESGGIDLVETIAAEAAKDFGVVGFVDDDCEMPQVAGIQLLGRIADLPTAVRRERPDLVVVAVSRNRHEVFAQLLDVADESFSVVGLPEFYEQMFGRLPVRDLTPAWFMSVLHLYQRPYSVAAKRAFDISIAALGLIAAAPLFPLIALLVRGTRGPVIYRQTRLGEGGSTFTIYKFRTMREDAEAPGHPAWATERDPRVTEFGRLLRQTRLDELPQLWNVLKGDMSIVGPRPERPEYLSMLSGSVPFWTSRHLLKPGITGWAQVSGGYASDCASTETKLAYDLWYLRHRSLAIDLLVCAKTVAKLVSGSGAR